MKALLNFQLRKPTYLLAFRGLMQLGQPKIVVKITQVFTQ